MKSHSAYSGNTADRSCKEQGKVETCSFWGVVMSWNKQLEVGLLSGKLCSNEGSAWTAMYDAQRQVLPGVQSCPWPGSSLEDTTALHTPSSTLFHSPSRTLRFPSSALAFAQAILSGTPFFPISLLFPFMYILSAHLKYHLHEGFSCTTRSSFLLWTPPIHDLCIFPTF